jgi:hypothetical protein
MSGWKSNDSQANNEPSFVLSIGRDQATTNAYSSNTILVTASRLANANSTTGMSSKQTAHVGWVNYKVGTGGRAGRIQSEVLVALSTPSSTNANSARPYFDGI